MLLAMERGRGISSGDKGKARVIRIYQQTFSLFPHRTSAAELVFSVCAVSGMGAAWTVHARRTMAIARITWIFMVDWIWIFCGGGVDCQNGSVCEEVKEESEVEKEKIEKSRYSYLFAHICPPLFFKGP